CRGRASRSCCHRDQPGKGTSCNAPHRSRNKKGRDSSPASVRPEASLLLLVLLGFLLLAALLLRVLLVAFLHFIFLFHRVGTGVGRREGKTARQRKNGGDQNGDQLPHVFPLREVKEQVLTSPLLQEPVPPSNALSFSRLTAALLRALASNFFYLKSIR